MSKHKPTRSELMAQRDALLRELCSLEARLMLALTENLELRRRLGFSDFESEFALCSSKKHLSLPSTPKRGKNWIARL